MPTVIKEVEREVEYWQCEDCYELFDMPKDEDAKQCPNCSKESVEPLKFPRVYAAPNRQKDGTFSGPYRLHLNQPLPEPRAANQPRAPKPTPAVAVFLAAFTVGTKSAPGLVTELGRYTGRLDCIGIVRHMVPHLRSGKIRDITNGDPLSPKDQENRAKSEEHRRMALLNFQKLHYQILAETSKEKKKKLTDRKRKWAEIAFRCSWCRKDYSNVPGLEDRAKRINAHARKCKGRPSDTAMDGVMKTHFGDWSGEIPQEFIDTRTGKTISTHADDPGPYAEGPFVPK